MLTTFLDSKGKIIFLGKEIGRGGEGAVFEVRDKADLVAKIYHEPIDNEKAEKLHLMAQAKNEKLLRLAAWVSEVLYFDDGKQVAGFLMPRLNFGKAIHELYNPQSRRQKFPEADWRFLVHAAANLARSFAVIHAHGHAIGDVNHSNVIIAPDATVRLIDCDSYHFNGTEKSFYCEVGVSTHTPPELQGKTLREIPRTENHDAFGLAVLIFQMLFMGRHPFSGAFLGEGEDNTLESSILEHRFAYGEGAKSRLMKQPPATLNLEAVSAPIAKLFERAFLQTENRPTAREWVENLEILGKNLQACTIGGNHFYLNSLAKCPWCELEKTAKIAFFPAKLPLNFGANGSFDLVTLENLFDSIKTPEISQSLVKTNNPVWKVYGTGSTSSLSSTVSLSPSAKLAENLTDLRVKMIFGLIIIGVVVFGLTFLLNSLAFTFLIILAFPIYSVCKSLAEYNLKEVRESVQLAFDNAKQKHDKFKESWSKSALLQPFEDTKKELKDTLHVYKDLSFIREKRLKETDETRYIRHLDEYLKKFKIRNAEIEGIGDRFETLKEHSISTAADISTKNFLKVKNVSHLHKRKLFDWRKDLEQKFTLQNANQIALREKQDIESEIAATRLRLENDLKSGHSRLQQIVRQIEKKQDALAKENEELWLINLQAATDFNYVEKSQNTANAWTIGVVLTSFILGFFAQTQITRNNVTGYYDSDNSVSKPSNKWVDTGNGKSDDILVEEPAPPEWGEAGKFYVRGNALYVKGKYQEAFTAHEQAVKLRPNEAYIQEAFGNTCVALSKFTEAAQAFETVLKLDKKPRSYIYSTLASTYSNLTRLDEAIKMYQKAIKADSKNSSNYFGLGQVLVKKKRFTEAKENFINVTALSPKDAEAHYELGLCNIELGDLPAANDVYEQLKKIDYIPADKLKNEIDDYWEKNAAKSVGAENENQTETGSGNGSGSGIPNVKSSDSGKPKSAVKPKSTGSILEVSPK